MLFASTPFVRINIFISYSYLKALPEQLFLILFSIIRISEKSKENEASIQAIKKYLGESFEKKANEKTNKSINSEITNLTKRGFIYNTSGKSGASGSFSIDTQFEDFDSRSLYQQPSCSWFCELYYPTNIDNHQKHASTINDQ